MVAAYRGRSTPPMVSWYHGGVPTRTGGKLNGRAAEEGLDVVANTPGAKAIRLANVLRQNLGARWSLWPSPRIPDGE